MNARSVLLIVAALVGSLTPALVLNAAASHGPASIGYERATGPVVTEHRPVAPFHRIESSGSTDLEVTIGGRATDVAIASQKSVLARITTSVSGGTLRIERNGHWFGGDRVRATIRVPSLDAVTLSGSGDAKIHEVSGERFAIDGSGSSSITADGTVGSLSLTFAGSNDASLARLHARIVKIDISGSASTHVYASDTLDVKVAGSGDVVYDGNPRVSQDIAGSGSVSRATRSDVNFTIRH